MRRHHGRAPSPYAGRTAVPLSAEVSLVRNFDSKINPTRPVRQSPLATSQIQGMPLDLIDRIRSFPLFQSAPDTFLFEIGRLLKPQMHSPNDYIMTEGDDAKAMYWIVRGAVTVTSRDGESTYAELRSGSFIGEIGILMDRPRTATVIAKVRCLTLQLKKEDLRKILPAYPEVERSIREEALERLAILERKKMQALALDPSIPGRRGSKRTRDTVNDEMDIDTITKVNGTSKKRKSPSPGMSEVATSSALGHGLVNVRVLLKELPLFADLPTDMLHFLGLNAQPRSFAPFTDIIKQDSMGREVFFIVRGEVEVLTERHGTSLKGRRNSREDRISQAPHIKARLKSGQYFGEVVSLSLADRRTATVRSVTQVECLMISENVLQEFWERCPADVKHQIEDTARQRLKAASENDVIMKDADTTPAINELAIGDDRQRKLGRSPLASRMTINDAAISSPMPVSPNDDPSNAEPSDPDPFRSIGLDNVRSRTRRGSLAPPSPDESVYVQKQPRRSPRGSPRSSPRGSPRGSPTPPPLSPGSISSTTSPTTEQKSTSFPFNDPFVGIPRPRPQLRPTLGQNRGSMPDQLLPMILRYFELHNLMKFRAVSLHWQGVLTKSPMLMHSLDLSRYNRKITDEALINHICPFVGGRPRFIDISNCFHVTDEGFTALATTCGTNATIWRMKSVWDVTAAAILEMSNRAKGLKEIDLSNCRKVSDTLLGRIVGWVVPPAPVNAPQNAHFGLGRHNSMSSKRPSINTKLAAAMLPPPPAPGTVFGCPMLSSITLSYCKHITDRTMHHIATHAASRVQTMDLTRCTTITDTGFSYWGNARFSCLRKLILADCTYLSDQSIVWLVHGAGQTLQELDLSFCCALSDTSTEVIALGCPNLQKLDMSFCGSAVSDASLRSIGNHLTALQDLAVRGCVRVTGTGVDSVVDGCHRLRRFDVSQCKNLYSWVEAGGMGKWTIRGRRVHFEMVKRSRREIP